MTVARRRVTPDAIAAPMPPAPRVRPARPVQVMPAPGDAPAPEVITPVGRLRRCTFRRVDVVAPLPARPALPTYEVMCLYADGDDPMPLGDVHNARPICEACTASGIFRPDED